MINRVTIRNFRALTNLTLDLGPFQVLIGENGSGKTSFLKSLVTLGRLLEMQFDTALSGLEFNFARNLTSNAVSEAIHWKVSTDKADGYALSVAPRPYQPGIRVQSETLTVDGQEVIRRARNQDNTDVETYGEFPNPDPAYSCLARMDVRQRYAPVYEVLSHIGLFALHPPAMVRPCAPNAILEPDGSGLPGLLDRLQNLAPERFEQLQAKVREVFPRVKFIRTPLPNALDGRSGDGLRELAVVEQGSQKLIYGGQLSDGLVFLIGYLSLVMSPFAPPSILLLDEPEIGLHMDRADLLVQLFRALSAGEYGPPIQVVMTTHSPDIVDFVSPEELVIFSRTREGGVVARRASDSSNLLERLKGYNLGEYWALFGEEGLLGEQEE